MKVNGIPYRPIWQATDGQTVEIIDQTKLPHAFVTARLESTADAAHAITAMLVRGAPLIGATAAWGLWLAMRADDSDQGLADAYGILMQTRPTAVNLRWALEAGRTSWRRWHRTGGRTLLLRSPARFVTRMWRSTTRSAGTVWTSSGPSPTTNRARR